MVDAHAMTQDERRLWLIRALKEERAEYARLEIPAREADQRDLLRALFNVRPPDPVSDEFLAVQDAYLQQRNAERGSVTLGERAPVGTDGVDADLYLWRGDITCLATDAIVNAANSQMLGCFVPGHHCIDNAIHTFAGVQLRLACNDLMESQGHEEGTGLAGAAARTARTSCWLRATAPASRQPTPRAVRASPSAASRRASSAFPTSARPSWPCARCGATRSRRALPSRWSSTCSLPRTRPSTSAFLGYSASGQNDASPPALANGRARCIV